MQTGCSWLRTEKPPTVSPPKMRFKANDEEEIESQDPSSEISSETDSMDIDVQDVSDPLRDKFPEVNKMFDLIL